MCQGTLLHTCDVICNCRAGKASRAAARALVEAEAQEAEAAQAAQLAQLSSAESALPAAAATEGAAVPAAAEQTALNTTSTACTGMNANRSQQQSAGDAGLLRSTAPCGDSRTFGYPEGLPDTTGALAKAGGLTASQQQDSSLLMSTHPDSLQVQ